MVDRRHCPGCEGERTTACPTCGAGTKPCPGVEPAAVQWKHTHPPEVDADCYCQLVAEPPAYVPTEEDADSSSLMSCPFCGGEAEFGAVAASEEEIYGDVNEGGEFIHCVSCDASTALVFGVKEDAKPHLRLLWNARTLAAPPPAYVPTEEDAKLLNRAAYRLEVAPDGPIRDKDADELRALAARLRGQR